jgi:hypothetical protein
VGIKDDLKTIEILEKMCSLIQESWAGDCARRGKKIMVTKQQVDAVLDTVDDDEDPAEALVKLLDEHRSWTIFVGSERGSVFESSGAWWAVRAGDHDCEACRRATYDEACALMQRWF